MAQENYVRIFENGRKSDQLDAIVKWWRSLISDNGKASRAGLKRCSSIEEVCLQPAFVALVRDLVGWSDSYRLSASMCESLALIAGVLAHVEGNRKEFVPFAEQMACSKPGIRGSVVSEQRFKILMGIDKSDKNELMRAVVSTIKLIGGSVYIKDLVQGLYWWNDSTMREWHMRYYMKKMGDIDRPQPITQEDV